jgi:thiosulfate/3-mercaptopyruvate sulfurtransferase
LSRKMTRLAFSILLIAIPPVLFAALSSNGSFVTHALDEGHPAAPWSNSQTVLPETLVKELSVSDRSKRPAIVYVGFRTLYDGAHIPDASFHGAGSTPQGITDLKNWAQNTPRSANIVLYCGCCPLEHCPNLRPAFVVLRDLGFTNLRVLLLPNDFNTDWIEKGFPVEKGK